MCIYTCPYARFQSAMFDRDTLVISYDTGRVPVRLDAPREALRSASPPVRFTIEAVGADEIRTSEEIRFLGPEARRARDGEAGRRD